jgi:hypothetical protein
VLHVTPALVPPRPSPSPSSSPTALRPSIVLSAATVKIGGPLTISGKDFDTGKQATLAIVQGGKAHTLVSRPIDVHSDGTFEVTVTIPSAAGPGAAEIVACSSSGAAVQPTPSQCALKPVRVQR